MLTITVAVQIEAESLRQRLPFVAALEGDEVFTLEPLNHLEAIADVIIRQVG